jgi:glycine/D-amino acid oxidase-like deaminating enzyme
MESAVWWLRDAERRNPLPVRPVLDGAIRADVCIVGGGYTGLWAAIELAEQASDLDVVVVEARRCGFGPSGRNGGWITGWHDELDGLIAHFGVEEGLRLAARSAWAIGRIRRFVAEHEIDCDLRAAGTLWTASSAGQLGAWKPALDACIEHGREDYLAPIELEELRRLTGAELLRGGIRQTDGATVQPALLAFGLAQVAERLGVRIFEVSPMETLRTDGTPTVVTDRGRVEADRVVLATGVWGARLPQLRRTVVPVGTMIVATAPIEDPALRRDWFDGMGLGDSQLRVHYAQVTPEGRVIFGRGGGAVGSRGQVVSRHFDDPEVSESVASDFRRWFPELREISLTHTWGGPVDRTPGHLPFVGRLDDRGRVVYGLGYSGNGVGPSALIGRMLGRMTLESRDEDTTGGLTRGPIGLLPPEPLRSIGGYLVQRAVVAAEGRDQEGKAPLPGSTEALRQLVLAHVPAKIDPRHRRQYGHERDVGSAPAFVSKRIMRL